jgi:hypothetical protein
MVDEACPPDQPCLFNLNTSMTEHDDVALANPGIVKDMLVWFEELAKTYHPPMENPPVDLDGCKSCTAPRSHRLSDDHTHTLHVILLLIFEL